MSNKIYPIGIQNFEDLRNNDCVYIDKTALIYHLTHTNKIYFLSRPRRFGKSLLVSTLEAYFSGKKELFEGLAMEQLEKEWTVYPVLHIDFSRTKYTTIEDLQEQLNLYLSEWERTYGKNEEETSYAARLTGLLQRIYQQTGKQAVVLIDEYDAPLLDSNSDSALQGQLRTEMRKFFSPLKAQGQYLRFLFLTGISKFEKLIGIVPSADDTLESRINRVLVRWNDTVPYTWKTLLNKLDTLCGGSDNYEIIRKLDEHKLEITTHLDLYGQVEELDYFLSYMLPASMVLDAKNKLFIDLNATARVAAGIVNCETFELSDSFKKNLDIQGTSIFGGGIVEGYMTTLSDAFKKGMSIDSGASFAGGVVGAVVVEISDSFKESIDVSGHTVMTAGVSITESN